MSLRTYHGSCHCGAVRFEADLDLAQPTYRCNCSICKRNRFWAAVVKPGTVLFEIGGTSEEAARLCFSRLAHKMPVKVRMIRRQVGT